MKALKTLELSKHNHYDQQIRTQFENIKKYIKRRDQKESCLFVTSVLEVQQSEGTQQTIFRVFSNFVEQPNLNQYYRKECLQMKKKKTKRNNSQSELIYFLEQLFQLLLKGGGIRNYFYTSNNIFIIPPQNDRHFAKTRLFLNITSTAGLKFLAEQMISREEFIEILPIIPPNIYQLLEAQQYDKLNVLLKIRSFAYHMLCHIINRTPYLCEENLPPQINPYDPKIRQIVSEVPHSFELLLNIERKLIKQAKQESKIEVKKFLTQVLVKNALHHWSDVLEMVFLQNSNNQFSYSRSRSSNQDSEKQPFIRNRKIVNEMLTNLWQAEPDKQFYHSLGLDFEYSELEKHVYLLVKLNSNFHKLLQHLNILEYFDEESGSFANNKIVWKFVKLFYQDCFPESKGILDSESRQTQLLQIQKNNEKKKQKKKRNQIIDKKKSYYPLTFNNIKGFDKRNPIQFLKNILTFYCKSGNRKVVQDQAEESQREDLKKTQQGKTVISVHNRLESLIHYQKQLWFT